MAARSRSTSSTTRRARACRRRRRGPRPITSASWASAASAEVRGTRSEVRRDTDQAPGRICPVEYRYSPKVFDRAPQLLAETLYVIGGLYGNVEALERVQQMARREPGPVSLVFNGD